MRREIQRSREPVTITPQPALGYSSAKGRSPMAKDHGRLWDKAKDYRRLWDGTKDYRRLWDEAASTNDEGRAVRNLADILVDKPGRDFISRLERDNAGLCIDILDHVSRDLFTFFLHRLR